MHLSIDTRITHKDLESTLITPGVVPGVDTKPVVLTVLGTPTDSLDGVTTQSITRLVGVDTTLVGEEIFVDGEGRSDGTVLVDIGFDSIIIFEAI